MHIAPVPKLVSTLGWRSGDWWFDTSLKQLDFKSYFSWCQTVMCQGMYVRTTTMFYTVIKVTGIRPMAPVHNRGPLEDI